MHFTYKDSDSDDLMQGDILSKTESLLSVIKKYHPYYADNDENTHFLVLTQSCDLARRSAKPCSGKYINLASIRPLSFFLDRVIDEISNKSFALDFPVCSDVDLNKIHELIQRLINNNESEYFFLRGEPAKNFPEDSCAFLKLSIAIHSHEHYEKCLSARLLQLKEPFQAKLGWAIGQMYSRVGTADWPSSEQKVFIKEIKDNLKAYWVHKKKESILKGLIEKYQLENPGDPIDVLVLNSLINKIPSGKEKAINRIQELITIDPTIKSLVSNEHLIEAEILKIIKRLNADPVLTSYFRD